MNKTLIIIIAAIVVVLVVIGFFIFRIFSSPPVSSNSSSIGVTNISNPSISFSLSKAGTINYTGGCNSLTKNAVKGTNKITFDSLPDGVYDNCKIIVTSGKTELTLNVSEFTIDTTKPNTTASTNGYVNGTWAKSVIISFSCNDSVSGCDGNTHYKINSSSEQRGNEVVFENNGVYKLEYWNIDNAGNEEVHKEITLIRIDKNPAQPLLKTASGYRNESFKLIYTPTSSNDSCYYVVDFGEPKGYGNCSGTFDNVILTGQANHTIAVYENSSVGNSASSNMIFITWDSVAPSVLITTPSAGTYNQTTWPGVTLANYTGTATCQYSTNGADWNDLNACSDTSNYSPSNGESQTLYIRGVDVVGNAGTGVSVTFVYNQS